MARNYVLLRGESKIDPSARSISETVPDMKLIQDPSVADVNGMVHDLRDQGDITKSKVLDMKTTEMSKSVMPAANDAKGSLLEMMLSNRSRRSDFFSPTYTVGPQNSLQE